MSLLPPHIINSSNSFCLCRTVEALGGTLELSDLVELRQEVVDLHAVDARLEDQRILHQSVCHGEDNIQSTTVKSDGEREMQAGRKERN